MATNTPKVSLMVPSRRKLRITRDENWPAASCSATIVIEKTSPVTEIMAEVIEERKLRALAGPPGNSIGVVMGRSSCPRTRASATATVTHTAGTTQKPSRTASRRCAQEVIPARVTARHRSWAPVRAQYRA